MSVLKEMILLPCILLEVCPWWTAKCIFSLMAVISRLSWRKEASPASSCKDAQSTRQGTGLWVQFWNLTCYNGINELCVESVLVNSAAVTATGFISIGGPVSHCGLQTQMRDENPSPSKADGSTSFPVAVFMAQCVVIKRNRLSVIFCLAIEC